MANVPPRDITSVFYYLRAGRLGSRPLQWCFARSFIRDAVGVVPYRRLNLFFVSYGDFVRMIYYLRREAVPYN